jgi:hypothetical protein
MSDINIYPFTRKIVLEQKTEAQQNALLAGTNRDVNPLVTPADYTPVYYTNQPIAGVTDELSKMKPTISVVETPSAPVQAPPVQAPVKSAGEKQPLLGTIVATALIVTAGFFLYKSVFRGK